jgi:serine/threonine protein phosphatase PrpC
MKFDIASTSDIGKRPNQEDAAWIGPDVPNRYVVIADGMGGANAGEEASRLAIEATQDASQAQAKIPPLAPYALKDAGAIVNMVANEAHTRILAAIAGERASSCS